MEMKATHSEYLYFFHHEEQQHTENHLTLQKNDIKLETWRGDLATLNLFLHYFVQNKKERSCANNPVL